MSIRSYRSELREAQAEATRERILDALVEVMAEGVESFSIPAVAKKAGVSVGTVYRHFGDKSGLLKALLPHAGKQTGTIIEDIPATLEELHEVIRKVFRHFENSDDLLKAAFTSRMGRASRMEWTEDRLEATKRALLGLEPGLDREDLGHLAKAALILTTSDAYREWRERLGLTPDEAADEVMWTIRTLLRGVSR
jgi:AcrR family transcriptional regulator